MTQPRRKQDREYWDKMAGRWDDEIFNTLHHDKFRVIAGEIERNSRRSRSVADFGCGTGIYLPLLSRLFDEVHGFERSLPCVAIAREKMERRANVAVHSSAASSLRRYGPFDTALCVNVAVHPSMGARRGVLSAVTGLLRPGGALLLVVPSLESATLVAAGERDALQRKRGARGDWEVAAEPGVVTIEGMPYKHYAKTELRDFLAGSGYRVSRIRKVEYSWRSQGVRPGAKYAGKLPWDWMAVARKT